MTATTTINHNGAVVAAQAAGEDVAVTLMCDSAHDARRIDRVHQRVEGGRLVGDPRSASGAVIGHEPSCACRAGGPGPHSHVKWAPKPCRVSVHGRRCGMAVQPLTEATWREVIAFLHATPAAPRKFVISSGAAGGASLGLLVRAAREFARINSDG